MTDSQLVAMSIKGLMLDPVSNSPIVVLKDEDDKFFLPIWVVYPARRTLPKRLRSFIDFLLGVQPPMAEGKDFPMPLPARVTT